MSGNVAVIHRSFTGLQRKEMVAMRRQFVRLASDPDQSFRMRTAYADMAAELGRELEAEKGWSFVLVAMAEKADVLGYLRMQSRRPAVAMHLWSVCISNMTFRTGEVALSRKQLSERLGVSMTVVSELMGELVKCGAIRRSFDEDDGYRGRSVRFFVNPRLATHLKGAARAEAQAKAPVPDLSFDGVGRRCERRGGVARVVPMSVVPTERRARAAPVVVPA